MVGSMGAHTNDHGIVGILVHEFRNPLASVQGCARTLFEAGEDLAPETRAALAEIILKAAQRLDWLTRAAGSFNGGTGDRLPEEVDIEQTVSEAAGLGQVKLEIGPEPATSFDGDPGSVRMALEALFLALGEAGAEARAELSGDVLRVSSTARDLWQGSRRWKLALAHRLLRIEGCRLTVTRMIGGTTMTVSFPRGAQSALATAGGRRGERR